MTRPASAVLVVDDDRNIRATMTVCLERDGHRVVAVRDVEAALAAITEEAFDAAFVDLRLGADDGLELLTRLLGVRPQLAVVMMTAYASVDAAVEAIKRGAVDFLTKPFTPAQVRHTLARYLDRRAADRRLAQLEHTIAREVPEVVLETRSPRMQALLDTAARAGGSEATLLLRGENGTGKGVLARYLHAQSPRADAPLVTVNCPTLGEELLAAELFGHVRGAFTGAVRDRVGQVEVAEGGTLFLDEIGEISVGLQAKLLRFLQERCFERVGDPSTRRADVRILAATNRDLAADVRAGRFREDLYFRLAVIELEVPPLRERGEDIVPLARHFLEFFAAASKRPTLSFSPEFEAALLRHAWPGNVRELRNAIERAVILSASQRLGRESLPPWAVTGEAVELGGSVTLEAIEREHIERVLARVPTQEEAARILGIDSSTLWRKRKRYAG